MRFPLPIFRVREMSGKNGNNTALVAAVDPRAPQPVAVAAQEIAEARRKLALIAGALLAGIVIVAAVYVSGLPIGAAAGAALPLIAVGAWLRSGPGSRWLELWGHEVEVQAAVAYYGVPEGPKRAREAAGMVAYSGYSFEDWTASEVMEAMKEHSAKARRWVEDHDADLAHAERKLS